MTTDVGFLYAMAGVSMSVASIAGLVVAFRRTGMWAQHDLVRLRQIVEWGFGNAVLALSTFPIVGLVGSEAAGLRIVGAVAVGYLVAMIIISLRRWGTNRSLVRITPLVVVVDLAAIMLTTSAAILGAMTAWELALLVLLIRPMIVFVWVLATLGLVER